MPLASPAPARNSLRDAEAMGVHAPGGIVFTTETTDWAQALDQDPRVARITRNVIEHLLA
jgi:hypothetical protein